MAKSGWLMSVGQCISVVRAEYIENTEVASSCSSKMSQILEIEND